MGMGKMSSEREKNLRSLAKLMNKQNVHSFPVTKPLLDCFDLVITPEENAFLLRMGTAPHTYQQVASLTDITKISPELALVTALGARVVFIVGELTGFSFFYLYKLVTKRNEEV